MTKVRTNANLLFACYITFLLVTVSCHKYKETVYHLQGRLLISNTNPVPVSSYTIILHQKSSTAGPFPAFAASSTVSTTTDQQGNFKCDFTPGEARVFGFRGPNAYPVNLSGQENASFPYFDMGDIVLGNLGDIYLCKKIDTVILTVDALWGIVPADTLRIDYFTINGHQKKLKAGMSATAGSLNVIIDTIYNAIFTGSDYKTKTYGYGNINIQQLTTTQTSFNIGYNSHWDSQPLPAGDEKKRVLHL